MSTTSHIGETERPWDQHIQENLEKWTRKRDGRESVSMNNISFLFLSI